MKRISLFLFSIFLMIGNIHSQVDTDFWFAAPFLSEHHEPQNYSIRLCFVTFDQKASIKITQPANTINDPNDPKYFEPITFDLEKESFTYISLNELRRKGILEIKPGKTAAPLPYGLRISSTAPISVYYAATHEDSEVYTLKGKNALGTKFIVPMQTSYRTTPTNQTTSSIEILATEDNTEVTIKTKVATTVKATPGEIKINLNKGEAFALKAKSGDSGSDNLHNTYITSNKDIVVNSTDDSVNSINQHSDLIGEQIVPTRLSGTEYIVVSNQGTYEEVYIFPTEENNPTNVNIGGINHVLNFGQEYKYKLTDNVAYITSDYPVIVFQITSIGNELGGTVLPTIECTGSDEAAYMPTLSSDNKVFINLVTKKEYINDFNNYITGNLFSEVPGSNDEWYYTTVLRGTSLNSNQPIRISNSGGVFHMSVIDGSSGSTCSYGYFSNYNSVPLGSKTSVSHYLEGDEISFVVPDANDYTNITVTLPDGTIRNTVPPFENDIVLSLPNVNKKNYEGEYKIEAFGGLCGTDPDYIQVSVYELPVPQDIYMCLGDALSISSPGYGPYQWKGDGEFGNTKTIEFIPTKGDTTYQVTVTSQQPGINIVSDGDFENRETDKINSDYTYLVAGTLSSGKYAIGSNPQSYHSAYIKHGDHTSGYGYQMIVTSSGNESTIWRQTLRGLIPGNMYEFSAWFLGVNPAASPVNIKYKMDGLFVNERDDQGELITDPEDNYYEVPQYTVEQDQEWHQLKYGFKAEGSVTDISIVLVGTSSGSAVSVDDIRLSPLYTMPDTFNIHVQDSLHPVLKGSPYICQGIATVGLEESYDSYEWSNGQTTPEATFSSTGEYSVQVTRGECQRGTLVFTINPSAKVSVTVEDVPELCLGSDYVDFPLTVTEGSLGYYSLHFDESAQSAHFQDLEMNESGEDYIRIPIPANALPGTYTMTLDVYEAGCQGKGDVLPGSEIEFTLKYGCDIIAQRWNDVLSVKSSDYTNGESFSGYQWYRNGEALPGETRPYYYNHSEFITGDCYSVTLTREDGTEVSSCEYCPEHIDAFLESSVSPVSLVNSSASLSLPSEDGVEGKAYIRDMNGGLITVQSYTGDSPEITAPSQQGVYVLEMVSDKDYRKYKIVVK